MRIDGFQNIPSILESFSTNRKSQPNSGNGDSEPSSSVSLSSFAGVLQSLQREANQVGNARNAHVESLANQHAAGNLTVDTGKIAEKLIDADVLNF